MNAEKNKMKGMKISLRFALFAWQVTFMTIIVLVLFIIPQQKRTFIQNLHSKANSLAVSLRNVTAGAAMNDDYASLVSASENLLAGDPGLDFLIIARNDGFSVISEQRRWRVETLSDSVILPEIREAVGSIETVPVVNRRVFHFAQPFDYSGIQWGWIHVGLSLEDYDKSVTNIYFNTILLAFLSIFFSFLLSLAFAKRLVRPIYRLRDVVRKVAGGDLNVRTSEVRSDELGDLADSINTMIESLLRRDRIMESVRFVGQQFLLTERWEDVINEILARIGQASNVSRAYFFENHSADDGRLLCSLRNEWTAEGINAELSNRGLQNLSYSGISLESWVEQLSAGRIICGTLSDMSPAEQALLKPQKILSIIVVPVFFEGEWRGFLGLDDCVTARLWTDVDKNSLRAVADMLGATHSRQLFQKALLESKATLEQRVDERTRELRDQVKAKEKALSDLAEAQSSLLEASRASGMAEVATGVLHNVGNVLNSVNVSCTLIRDQLGESRIGNVARVAALLEEHKERLAWFITEDPRGRQIPAYLLSLGSALEEENQTLSREAESLRDRMEHIKEIVSMQQNYGRFSGVKEAIAPEQLMEDALKLNSGSLVRNQVTVQREYEPVAPIVVDKHKVLQILLNLINNARFACDANAGREKVITLRISTSVPDRLIMQVADNGIGIDPENLTRIFQHGFTTRKAGHGFGLHSGALAAKELGGSLNVNSDGPGLGATFTLDLPYIHQGVIERDIQ